MNDKIIIDVQTLLYRKIILLSKQLLSTSYIFTFRDLTITVRNILSVWKWIFNVTLYNEKNSKSLHDFRNGYLITLYTGIEIAWINMRRGFSYSKWRSFKLELCYKELIVLHYTSMSSDIKYLQFLQTEIMFSYCYFEKYLLIQWNIFYLSVLLLLLNYGSLQNTQIASVAQALLFWMLTHIRLITKRLIEPNN